MKIPPPPVIEVPKPCLFPGAQRKQQLDALGGDIRDMLIRLARATHVPSWQEMFWGFRDVVSPGGVCDVSRLPYQASGPNLSAAAWSTRSAPVILACLYTRLSWIVQMYWTLCLHGAGDEAPIREYMQGIDEITQNDSRLQRTLCDAVVCGSVLDGYWIEVKANKEVRNND